jgi:glycosyltransferase involved in cell wall biosynthesis
MKICLYSPYLPDHFGGGEKYLLDVALGMVEKGHEVKLAVSSEQALSPAAQNKIKQSYEDFLDCDLSQVGFIATPLGTKAGLIKRLLWTHQFDALFYLTDGSLFFSMARHNILHIQVPLKLDKSSFIQKLKLKNWQVKTTNSYFTQAVVEPSWPVEIDLVHQPMVQVKKISQQVNLEEKQKIILNVGRFYQQLHSKRQDILVKIFKRLLQKYKGKLDDWQLVLIGSAEDEEFAEEVAKSAQDLPVKILHSVSRKELLDWYQKSSIYWHATGYRVNPFKEPEKVEHFGISTVEAMAAGNVPLVIGKGGQIEVVGRYFEDWTWLTQQDCIKKTYQVIRNHDLRLRLQQEAIRQAQKFGPQTFKAKLKQILP